ncbi:secretin N-terminal domain-containing protein [Roseimaritima sediminicola]|uniref:secretin N-terminal domain-containing protein n=1 Tax=Roseimaritima sediminicola TaxID=2662066 RepID=UPI0012983071|nr:secretin N-terminal domain-containing protein [Roseimaritima sediminicola]
MTLLVLGWGADDPAARLWGQGAALQAAPAARPAQAGPQGKPQPGRPPGGKPPGEGKPGNQKPGEQKPGEGKPGEEKPEKEDTPKTIQRPNEPASPPDPAELNVRPGDDNRLAFSFRNQPWVAILEWFAEISDMPLDWREVPADHVNIASSGRYDLDQVRDLLNRHLLARGFVMLKMDDGLMVVKTENINPALVPRVTAGELADLQPHDFVRTSLDVGWLSAKELAEELKPLISGNGTLVAMATTNRIEAMDAAINLLQISQLLEREQSPDSRRDLAPEFELRHVPAIEAKAMLEAFLGVGKDKQQAPMTPQQMQMMQQMRAQQGGKPAPPTKKEPEISIVANPRRNSIILHAPPNRIAVATEFLARIDVPSDSIVSLADIENRLDVFRLTSLDPEKLLEIIRGMNILEPTTQIEVDEENQAVIVSGSGADRFIVRSLIQRLDGSGRQFYVLPVRFRDPRAVAESIAFLVGDEDKEDTQTRRPYYMWGGNQQEDKKNDDKFRVAADVQFRQILLWANEYEMEDVRSLLVKLGELPPPGGNRATVRVLDAAPTPQTYQYLQRLRDQFQLLAPNAVELPEADAFPDPNTRPNQTDAEDPTDASDGGEGDGDGESDEKASPDAPAEDDAPAGDDAPATGPEGENTAIDLAAHQEGPLPEVRSGRDFDRLFGSGNAGTSSEEASGGRPDSVAAAPPAADGGEPAVRFEVDAQGRILMISRDTEALDRMENLMLQAPPPQRPYEVFYVQHTSAYWMELNLTDFFEDTEQEDSSSDSFFRWYWDMPAEEESQPGGLGASQPLKFVSDDDTNTVIVTGATKEQLQTIGELIELWDVPEPVNKRRARYTRLVPVQYSRAEKIAETVKDAYRDLLSSNDKAFQQGQGRGGGQGGQQQNMPDRARGGNGSELVDQGGKEGGGSDFTFKGKLSVGVDEVGNTLLVSAEGEPLLELVVDMIRQLDEAARPQGDVQVHRAVGSINIESLEAALQAFTDEPIGRRPNRQPATTESNDKRVETNP